MSFDGCAAVAGVVDDVVAPETKIVNVVNIVEINKSVLQLTSSIMYLSLYLTLDGNAKSFTFFGTLMRISSLKIR